jgi:phage-related protein
MSGESRVEAGYLLRHVVTSSGSRTAMRRGGSSMRIIYRVDPDAIVVAEVFSKKTQRTPKQVIDTCKKRLRGYDDA